MKVQFEVSGQNLEIFKTWDFYRRFCLPTKFYSWTNLSFLHWLIVLKRFLKLQRGMVFYQVFLLSKSQVQAVEISSQRKPKVGSKICYMRWLWIAWRKSLKIFVPITSKNSASDMLMGILLNILAQKPDNNWNSSCF